MCDVCDDRLLYIVDVRSLILQVLKKAADFQEHCCRLAAQELCEEYARIFFPKEDLPKWLLFVGYAWLMCLLSCRLQAPKKESTRVDCNIKQFPRVLLLLGSWPSRPPDLTVLYIPLAMDMDSRVCLDRTLGKLPGPGSVSRRPILLACGWMDLPGAGRFSRAPNRRKAVHFFLCTHPARQQHSPNHFPCTRIRT